LDKLEIIKNPETFLKKIREQKKIFIDEITEGITRKKELETINAIRQRIDFFIQEYYLQVVGKIFGINTAETKTEK